MRSVAYTSYKYPDDFYHEDLGGASIYYNNTLSILPLGSRTRHWVELSTDDRDQAFAWSVATDTNSAYHRDLVSERQTDKYFEFRRVYLKNPTDDILSKVHKLSDVDRSMFDYFNPAPLIAKLNIRPIDFVSFREFVGYYWFVQNYNIGGEQVLATFSRQSADSVWCVVYQLSVNYGDIGMHDEISLGRSLYSVSRQTGDVFLSSTVLRTIQGR